MDKVKTLNEIPLLNGILRECENCKKMQIFLLFALIDMKCEKHYRLKAYRCIKCNNEVFI